MTYIQTDTLYFKSFSWFYVLKNLKILLTLYLRLCKLKVRLIKEEEFIRGTRKKFNG